MALQLKYQGRNKEKNAEGTIITITWYGTREECESYLQNAVINSTTAGLGRLVGASMAQGEVEIN